MTQSHQLAAIMFTDIVGYSALMGEDEGKAFELLKSNRKVQRPIIEKYNGRWLKEIGDGVLASFNSVSDAVYCAAAIQKTSEAYPQLNLRIGIHLGEVVFEGNDVFGDGVNIASRIEPIAPVGGILVTEAVHNNVTNKQDIESTYVGERQLKHVAKPIKVYELQVRGVEQMVANTEPSEGRKVSSKANISRKHSTIAALVIVLSLLSYIFYYSQSDEENAQPLSEVADKSIAVLPFVNMSNDPDQQYFSDGIAEEIINALAQIPNLKVASRTSTFQFREQGQDIQFIGDALGVATILEGSIRKSNNTVRVTAQLINVADGFHLWSQTYERELDDIFSIQSDVAKNIAEILQIALGMHAQNRLDKRPTTNLEAYQLFLKGQYHINAAGFVGLDTAIALLNQAILLDPNFALAQAVLARTYILNNANREAKPGWSQKAYVAFQQALTLDPDLADGYVARGMWYWTPSNNFDHEHAIRDFQKAIELKPGLSSAYELLSLVQLHVGLFDMAMETGKIGLDLEPTSMWSRHFLGQVYFFQGNYIEALNLFDTVDEEFIPFFRIALTAQTLYYLDRVNEAIQLIEEGLSQYPNEAQLNSSYAIILASMGNRKEARKRMDLAIENEKELRHVHHLYHNLAAASSIMGAKIEAVSWLNRASAEGLPNYPLFLNDPNLKNLQGDPGYEALMQKLKLKWEYYKSL